MRFWHRGDSGDGWERPTGVSAVSSLLFAVGLLVVGFWTFPVRPGWVADEATVLYDLPGGRRYATVLVVEFPVADAPVRAEITVSRQIAAAFLPVPALGDTVPVFRNKDGSALRYAGTAAWVNSGQVFAAALVAAWASLRAYRASRR